MIGIPIGLAFANAFEWYFHKRVLHGVGKNKRSFWSFHFHEHHRVSRRNDMLDPVYEQSLLSWNAHTKEAVALAAGAVLIAPLFPFAPFFVGTLWWSQLDYYRTHKRSHTEPGWAKEHLPWHYAHHMGRDQEMNWCVTRPWFDRVVGTAQAMPERRRPANAVSSKSAAA